MQNIKQCISSKLTKNHIILIDGSLCLYRAYYAVHNFKNDIGIPIGAIYGFISIIKSILKKYTPSNIVIIFDSKEGSVLRKKIFKYYKFNRTPMPNDLRIQIKPLHNIIEAIGLPLLNINKVEADDVIGTLAIKAEKRGQNVLIITSDKDMTQLVTHNIKLLNIISNTILGPNEVLEKYGVPPSLIIDLIALMGDKSDNIPGVPGIGKVIAQTLLKNLGNLKTIYNNIDKISKLSFRGSLKISTILQEYRQIAFLSYKLATINTNVKSTLLDNEQFIIKKPDLNELKILFKYYKLENFLYFFSNQ